MILFRVNKIPSFWVVFDFCRLPRLLIITINNTVVISSNADDPPRIPNATSTLSLSEFCLLALSLASISPIDYNSQIKTMVWDSR